MAMMTMATQAIIQKEHPRQIQRPTPLAVEVEAYAPTRLVVSVPFREVFLRGFFFSLGWSSPSRFLFGRFSAVAASSSCHVPWHTQQ